MNFKGFSSRAAAGLLLIPLALSTMAPIAEANHGGGRRYKDWDGGGRAWKHGRGGGDQANYGRGGGGYQANYGRGGYGGYGGQRVVVVKRGSSAGPVIAGIIGGIALGATLANANQRDHCQSRGYESAYSYYDPYCRESFASFDACASHEQSCGHPRMIRMIDASNGQCVHSYGYQPGGWVEAGYQANNGYDRCAQRGGGDRCNKSGDWDRRQAGGYDDQENGPIDYDE
jgi:hypothetical protein